MLPQSIPYIADVHVVRGTRADHSAAIDVLFEVPHGATATADFDELAARLRSELPAGLVDFFHVNTDVGAFEVSLAAAHALVAAEPDRSVLIVRCRIPRTFIDTNRRIDATAEEFRAGGVTPGVAPYITHHDDLVLLRGRYDAYQALVRAADATLAPDAGVVLLHTYAPRTVDVQVDADIVTNLRRAYEPHIEPTWPLRPELDVIARDAAGTSHAPASVVAAFSAAMAELGWPVADSATYPMHPSTMAWDHAQRRPGRTLCLEVRRDLLADPFDPFVQMTISQAKVDRIAGPLAHALRTLWPAAAPEPA